MSKTMLEVHNEAIAEAEAALKAWQDDPPTIDTLVGWGEYEQELRERVHQARRRRHRWLMAQAPNAAPVEVSRVRESPKPAPVSAPKATAAVQSEDDYW